MAKTKKVTKKVEAETTKAQSTLVPNLFITDHTYKTGTTVLNIGNRKTQYNLLKQCYLHLKTMDGFTDAIDS